mmetsp:Transcript_17870/g.51184  ORF Transcript_17870/g.51184 Transcript_17870/m.51184 type:complete len:313 (-) Transcript_17870:309-1247(-)
MAPAPAPAPAESAAPQVPLSDSANPNATSSYLPMVSPLSPSVYPAPIRSLIAQHLQRRTMAVADTGATRHMIPQRAAFVQYVPTPGNYVTLANDAPVPSIGVGTAHLRVGPKIVDVPECLHVPSLSAPLYSIVRHHEHPGCSFLVNNDSVSLDFPGFTALIDSSVDCHIKYEAVGPSLPADLVLLPPPDASARSVHSHLFRAVTRPRPPPRPCRRGAASAAGLPPRRGIAAPVYHTTTSCRRRSLSQQLLRQLHRGICVRAQRQHRPSCFWFQNHLRCRLRRLLLLRHAHRRDRDRDDDGCLCGRNGLHPEG